MVTTNVREKLMNFLNTESDVATLDVVVPIPRIPSTHTASEVREIHKITLRNVKNTEIKLQ